MAAQRWLAADEGLFVEPSGAVAIAGLKKSLETGQANADDCMVAILTGRGLKDMGNLPQDIHVPLIDNDLDQLNGYIRRRP